MKLMIATPMYGGMCTGQYTSSMINIVPTLSNKGIQTSFAFIYNDSLITNARNKLATIFLKHDFTHMLFIDADVGFDANDIASMIEADKGVIGGIYPKKSMNWERIKEAVKNDVPTDQLEFYAGDLVINLLDYEREKAVKVNEPVEVTGLGTGFMLIKKEVIEQLKDKVDTYLDDDESTLYEYFFLKKDPVLGKQLTEDYAFCGLCRENGISIYAAPWVRLNHTGTYTFRGAAIPIKG